MAVAIIFPVILQSLISEYCLLEDRGPTTTKTCSTNTNIVAVRYQATGS